VSFNFLANLRKLKKHFFEGWAGVMKRGVLVNEKPDQGVRERIKMVTHRFKWLRTRLPLSFFFPLLLVQPDIKNIRKYALQSLRLVLLHD
jgi:hypothetical protein